MKATSSETAQIPDWLQITKIAEGYYRVTDTSVESVGLHLGSFPTQQTARRFAAKVSEARAETRARNLRQARNGQSTGSSIGL